MWCFLSIISPLLFSCGPLRANSPQAFLTLSVTASVSLNCVDVGPRCMLCPTLTQSTIDSGKYVLILLSSSCLEQFIHQMVRCLPKPSSLKLQKFHFFTLVFVYFRKQYLSLRRRRTSTSGFIIAPTGTALTFESTCSPTLTAKSILSKSSESVLS